MAQKRHIYINFNFRGEVEETELVHAVSTACNGAIPERLFPKGMDDAELDAMWFVRVPQEDADRALAALQAVPIIEDAEYVPIRSFDV